MTTKPAHRHSSDCHRDMAPGAMMRIIEVCSCGAHRSLDYADMMDAVDIGAQPIAVSAWTVRSPLTRDDLEGLRAVLTGLIRRERDEAYIPGYLSVLGRLDAAIAAHTAPDAHSGVPL